MPGIVPAIPRACAPDPAARLVDHYPDDTSSAHKRYSWGSIEVLSSSAGHRIERIAVNKGKSLPAHFHKHRSEHWTVVDGEAEVLLGDDVLIVAPDDSLYVPVGIVHAIKPAEGMMVKIIAVHFGDVVSDSDDMFDAA